MREARIINNCFEETSGQSQVKKAEKRNKINVNNNKKYYSFHPYICVIAIFDEIDANKKPFNVNLQYEYIAQNILRFKDNTNTENTVVWYYDNYKRIQPVENVKFSLELVHNNILMNKNGKKDAKNKLTGYPDKFTNKWDVTKNATVFSWDLKSIGENDYQKISIDVPLFNKKCRKLVKKLKIFFIFFYFFSMMCK